MRCITKNKDFIIKFHMPCSALFCATRKNYLFENTQSATCQAIGWNAVKFASKMEIISFFVQKEQQTHSYINFISRDHTKRHRVC